MPHGWGTRVERILELFMYIKNLFLTVISIFIFLSLNSNLVYAQSPDCVTRSANVTWYDTPSLSATFPWNGFRVGDVYRYNVPNSACIAKNSNYPYPYYYGYDAYGKPVTYPYPYLYPNPVTWSWSKGPVTGNLWKVHSYCYLDNFLGADVSKCR